MPSRNPQKKPELNATMRDFRAAPTKHLRRAARTGASLRLGEFVLEVREDREEPRAAQRYGAMAETGEVLVSPSELHSADDEWRTDEAAQDGE